MSFLERKSWQWIVLFSLAFIWGTSFILMKKGLESYSNYQVAALRVFITFIVLIPLIINRLKRITKENYKALFFVGFIGNGIPALLFTTAQKEIDSSLAGMLNSITPLFTLLTGVIFFNSKFRWVNVIGIIIGLIGAIGLMYKGTGNIFSDISVYALLIIFANFCYGTNINVIKYKLQNIDGISITALAFLMIGPFAGIYLLFSDFSVVLQSPNYIVNFWYIVVLAVFSSAIAVAGINILIKYTSPIFASSVTYIIPIFAIFWGILDGEIINVNQIVFMGISVFGVILVNKKGKE